MTPHGETPAVRFKDVTKRFGDFTAVDAVDFDVQPGEAFGFLGPNGAGKTSTMRMVGCISPVTAARSCPAPSLRPNSLPANLAASNSSGCLFTRGVISSVILTPSPNIITGTPI